MDIKEILTGLLVKAYKMTTEEITELLENAETDGGATLSALLERDKTRIGELGKTKYQEAFKKVKGETLTEFEKSLKESMEIDSDLTGIELINHIIASKATEPAKGGKKVDLTEDDIKKTPTYQSLLEQSKKELKAKETEWEGKLTEERNGYAKKETLTTVKQRALNLLKDDVFVFPEDATVAANQKNFFAKQLEEYDFEVQGDRTVVMKDGKIVEDDHGNPRTFEEIVQERASSFFAKKANNGGGNAGNNNNGGKEGGNTGGTNKFAGQLPKTFEELSLKMSDGSMQTADKAAMMEAWEAANPG